MNYGEPWTATHETDEDAEILKADGTVLLSVENWEGVCPSPEVIRRIVACVNFCRNLPDEMLRLPNISPRPVSATTVCLYEFPDFHGPDKFCGQCGSEITILFGGYGICNVCRVKAGHEPMQPMTLAEYLPPLNFNTERSPHDGEVSESEADAQRRQVEAEGR